MNVVFLDLAISIEKVTLWTMLNVVHYTNKTVYFYTENHKYIHYMTSFSTRIMKSITFAFVEHATMTNNNQYKALLHVNSEPSSFTHKHTAYTHTHAHARMHAYTHMYIRLHIHTHTLAFRLLMLPIDGLPSHRQTVLYKAPVALKLHPDMCSNYMYSKINSATSEVELIVILRM